MWTCEYDKNQIAQVIDNIVINAHHAMPGGGITVDSEPGKGSCFYIYLPSTGRAGEDAQKRALTLFSQYRQEEPPLTAVILDLTIPGAMGGKKTVAKIRVIDKEIPVFVASGYSDDDALSSPESFGFTDAIEKPFLSENLVQMLKGHLKGAGS